MRVWLAGYVGVEPAPLPGQGTSLERQRPAAPAKASFQATLYQSSSWPTTYDFY